MKVTYLILGLFLIALISGCATTAPPAAPAAPPAAAEEPAETAEEEIAQEEAATPEAAEAEEAAETQWSEAQQATIDRLKAQCEGGNTGACFNLKKLFCIEMQPAAAEATTE